MEFAKRFSKDFIFSVTQVLGLTNDDAVSTKYHPFKQMTEQLNLTYKVSYRCTNGFDNIDGAQLCPDSLGSLLQFLHPHKHTRYKVLNDIEMLKVGR